MAVIERDGCEYADDEMMRELLESWDDDDVVCDCFPCTYFRLFHWWRFCCGDSRRSPAERG